nr:family 20 glycosylhydrolase [Chitinophagaceae bacterium]
MKKAIFFGALFISLASIAQKVNIIPQPNEIKVSNSNKKFEFTAATKIYYSGNEHLKKDALYLQSYLQQYYQIKPEVLPTTSKKTEPYIFLQENNTNKQGHTEGAYTMEITKKSIEIASENNTDGVFCGIQTLIQLLPTTTSNIEIPQLSIKDAPRFQYRGMHLDVSRHFFPVSFIKKYIDYLAYHKLNEFHWHLTDDQGWRIEIKKYPKLTSIGAWRNGTLIGRYPGTGNDNKKYGGYYTQDEI